MRVCIVFGIAAFSAACGDASSSARNATSAEEMTWAELNIAGVVKSAKEVADETPLSVAADCSLTITEILQSSPSGLMPLNFADGTSVTPAEMMDAFWMEIASHHGFSGSYDELAAKSRYYEALHNGGMASIEGLTKNNPRAKADLEKCNDSLNTASELFPRPAK